MWPYGNLRPLFQPTVLPPTLVDQIRLWELERERLFFQEGCLYEQFAKNTDFEMIRDYAKVCFLLPIIYPFLDPGVFTLGVPGAQADGRLQGRARRCTRFLEATTFRITFFIIVL